MRTFATWEDVPIFDSEEAEVDFWSENRPALRLMEAQDELRTLKVEQLRRDLQQGLDSGPARPWNVEETKREGRKRATRAASAR